MCIFCEGHTNDFDVDGGASLSQFVLHSDFVLSRIRVHAVLCLQTTASILLAKNTMTTSCYNHELSI